MRKPRTLRGRLAAWYSAVLAATLLAFAACVYFVVDPGDDDEPPAAPAAGMPPAPPEHVGRRLLVALGIAVPGALAVAIAGGFWITRRSLQPLDGVARLATELGAERLDRRVELPADAAAELLQLGQALNSMLGRLDRSVAGMRRFTADASHELRTPLAALRGELEVTLRRPRTTEELTRTCEGALEEVERLSELVESLLTLARSDAGELPLRCAPENITEIVRRVLSPYDAVATERQLTLSLTGDAACAAAVDATWLSRAVANLVDNACKLTPASGRVDVDVRATGDAVQIAVSDTGPGFTPEEAERLFERFYRGSRARQTEGFGLGLALARDIVRALGGTLAAESNGGGGARFVITLPRAT